MEKGRPEYRSGEVMEFWRSGETGEAFHTTRKARDDSAHTPLIRFPQQTKTVMGVPKA